jgi:hypothetical protein
MDETKWKKSCINDFTVAPDEIGFDTIFFYLGSIILTIMPHKNGFRFLLCLKNVCIEVVEFSSGFSFAI